MDACSKSELVIPDSRMQCDSKNSNPLDCILLQDLAWIAKEGLKAPLPKEWKPWCVAVCSVSENMAGAITILVYYVDNEL